MDNLRVKELNEALLKRKSENQEISQAFQITDGVVIVSDEQKNAFKKNLEEMKEIKMLIDGLTFGTDEKSMYGSDRDSVAAQAAAQMGGYAVITVDEAKSLGQLFVESPEFKSLGNGRNGFNMAQAFELKQGNLGGMYSQKDVYSAMPTGTPGSFGRIQRDPMVLTPKRTSRVRDLFPVRTTDAAMIEYFRQTGFTNNASPVAERVGNAFGLKPQSTIAFEGAQAPVRTIAHWEAAHRTVLADEPQLRGIIDNELLYGLRLEEDRQILYGNGSGENLLGIINTPNIQTYDWSAGQTLPVPDTMADSIRRAATLAYLAEYPATGVVLHPLDWEKVELTKNENGTYLFATSMQVGGEARVWNMPIIDSPAIAEGEALVGAFGTGAQLYDREQSNIRISEQHADFFIRNAIVVLAEERLALAVKRPEAFVHVTFDAAPS